MTACATSYLAGAEQALRPPPRLSLSEWAERHFVLSAESAAEPGRWRTLPYQRGPMDAITDPEVERVTFMKSARVGFTKIVDAAIGYFMHQDPCPILVVQPTVEDAAGFSKEEIAPMVRDVDVLARIVQDQTTAKIGEQTILAKTFPGGVLTMVGANSGRGFRRVSRRVVIFDEVDGYPPSAGSEGDQIQLGIKRTEYYWNRKIIAGSTPLVSGASRIEAMFLAGDQRRYQVPCRTCGHRDILAFHEGERGHFMRWPEGEPEKAFFVCRACGGIMEDHQKRALLEAGDWVAEAPFRGHASFHIWAAYSLSPNAGWGTLAREFVDANRGGPEKLKTFVNTSLGETWHERGEAPEWERLYQRRESYPIGSVPAGVEVLTAGVDVQKDRLVFEVVGWGLNKESWSVDAGVLMGDTSADAVWAQLDELLAREFPGEGGALTIRMLAVDSGYNTQQVYSWARHHPMSRVIACKGAAGARMLVGVPSAVDVTTRGRRFAAAYKVWIVGVAIAKTELYGWLRLERPKDGESAPPGYCHFPEHDEEYFRQLTAEQLVTVMKRNRFTTHEWQLIPNRQNHWLDCRVLARAAASVLGLDRLAGVRPAPAVTTSPSAPAQGTGPSQPPTARRPAPPAVPSGNAPGRAGSFWGGRGGGGGSRGGRGGGGWFGKR